MTTTTDMTLLLPANMSVAEYLEQRMGPQHISLAVVIPITALYVFIFVTGVVGNVVVCLVIARNSHFQTPTNYYLCSLAISDLLILLCGLPNDLKVYWQQYPYVFGETVCKVRALVAEMTSYASVLTIAAFTVERHVAICHPLLLQAVSTLSRAIKIIAAVWIISCLCALPFAFFTKINYIEYPDAPGVVLQESAFCALPMENNDVNLPLLQFSTFVFFCLPMTLIVILYVRIGLKVRDSRFSRVSSKDSSGKSSATYSGDSRQHSPRRSIHKMLVAVVIAFFVCWAPFHAQRLLVVYVKPHQWTRELRTLNEVLFYVAGCLYYFSATINPILYSLMSAKYREAFRETLCLGGSAKRDPMESLLGTPRHHSDHRSVADRNTKGASNGCLGSPIPSCPDMSSREPSPLPTSGQPPLRWTTADKSRERTSWPVPNGVLIEGARTGIMYIPDGSSKECHLAPFLEESDRTNHHTTNNANIQISISLPSEPEKLSQLADNILNAVDKNLVIPSSCPAVKGRSSSQEIVDTWVKNSGPCQTSVVSQTPDHNMVANQGGEVFL